MLKKDRVVSDDPQDPENQACAAASARGARLMLSGWGGDEGATFNGRGALASALCAGRWPYLRREMRALRQRRGFTSRQIIQGEILTYLRAGVTRGLGFGRNSNGVALQSWLRLLQRPAQRQLLGSAGPQLRVGVGVRRNQARLLAGSHLEARTSDWAEIGARYGMAFAFPMLDQRVVECALSMPGEWYLREGWKRSLFRDAMQGVLPEVIRRRHEKLTPFPLALRSLNNQAEELASQLRVMLTRPAFQALFDPSAVEETLDDLLPGSAVSAEAATSGLLLLGRLLAYGDFLLREQTPHASSRPVPLMPAFARRQHG